MKSISRFPLLHWARHIKIENKKLKLLSLVLAVLLFTLARQPTSDVRLSGVPIEFNGLRPGMELSGDVAQTASLRLRGPRDLVRSLLATQLSVPADLSNKAEGERIIQLRPEDVTVPDKVQVLQIEPSSLKVRLEHTQRKTVPVVPQLTGAVAAGMECYDVRAVPDRIELEGPRSELDAVEQAITETINLTGHSQNFSTRVDVEAPRDSLRVVTKGQIELRVEIGEQRVVRRLENIPLQLPAEAHSLQPQPHAVAVELYGPRSALAQINASDLRAELATETVTEGAERAPVRLRLPPGANPRIEIRAVLPAEIKLRSAH